MTKSLTHHLRGPPSPKTGEGCSDHNAVSEHRQEHQFALRTFREDVVDGLQLGGVRQSGLFEFIQEFAKVALEPEFIADCETDHSALLSDTNHFSQSFWLYMPEGEGPDADHCIITSSFMS